MIKINKIGQYRDAIRHLTDTNQFEGMDAEGNPIFNKTKELPMIPYLGTVKVHGTSAGIHFSGKDRKIVYQSKNNTLTLEKDNAGFCAAMMHLEGKCEAITNLINKIDIPFRDCESVTIYGEWAGAGIQKGVGVSGLAKALYLFAVRYDNSETEESYFIPMFNYRNILHDPENGIFNLWNAIFPQYVCSIDLNYPGDVIKFLIDLTEEVERSCPVASAFGVDGVGEGVVWTPRNMSGAPEVSGAMFKVKGSKHLDTKVKTIVSIDPQIMEDIGVFVHATATDHRLQKGIDYLNEQGKPLELSSTGDFIKWVMNDIMSEERDTIVASNLNMKYLPKTLSKEAAKWYHLKIKQI